MAKVSRNGNASTKLRQPQPPKARGRSSAVKAPSPAQGSQAHASESRTSQSHAAHGHPVMEPQRAGWATDLVFDVREPKLAVSLRLDADVLRFFRGFGAGYQTRINEVLKAFMQARGGAEHVSHAVAGARASRASISNGKRARQ